MEEKKIIKFLNNKSSPKERKEVMEWLDRRGAEQQIEEMLTNHWEKNDIPASQDEDRYHQILKEIHKARTGDEKAIQTKIINRKVVEIGRMAATYLLLLFSAYILYQFWKPVNPEHMTEELPVQKIERKTGTGEKLRITLPDQSKVILNSLSTLNFDSNFGKTDRLIQLDGEAYFEITPNQDSPFKVRTGGVVTTALGTSFNAYSRNGQVAVSLTGGKVKVSHKINEVELIPGEMAAVRENTREGLKIEKFDPVQTTAWKEGDIRFQSRPFGEIIATLEEWYGVNITVQGQVDQNRKVTGLFENESLEEILKGLSFSLGLEYTINGKTVTLKPQPPMK